LTAAAAASPRQRRRAGRQPGQATAGATAPLTFSSVVRTWPRKGWSCSTMPVMPEPDHTDRWSCPGRWLAWPVERALTQTATVSGEMGRTPLRARAIPVTFVAFACSRGRSHSRGQKRHGDRTFWGLPTDRHQGSAPASSMAGRCRVERANQIALRRSCWPGGLTQAWRAARVRKRPRSMSVRKSQLGVSPVPLIGQLSNQEFDMGLGELLAVRLRVERSPDMTLARSCVCGCGRPVAGSRKFVNQDQYSGWLGRVPSFG
jgi:hypothetical protein